jgi:hypothetical protein
MSWIIVSNLTSTRVSVIYKQVEYDYEECYSSIYSSYIRSVTHKSRRNRRGSWPSDLSWDVSRIHPTTPTPTPSHPHAYLVYRYPRFSFITNRGLRKFLNTNTQFALDQTLWFCSMVLIPISTPADIDAWRWTAWNIFI